jgi:hypothetical protein
VSPPAADSATAIFSLRVLSRLPTSSASGSNVCIRVCPVSAIIGVAHYDTGFPTTDYARTSAVASNCLTEYLRSTPDGVLRITPRRRSDPIQLGPSIGLPTARYSSRTWLAARYCGRMFSSGVTGTRNHRRGIKAGPTTLSGGASGASLVSRFGRSLKR